MRQTSLVPPARPAKPLSSDLRWSALDAVKAARKTLCLTDRDIAVLRGLLSFIPADRWDGPLMVHAANRTLQDRCDGIDERTLRRRLAHLCKVGLITRHQSPNRKRYVVRDEHGQTVLAYGFCLMPLRACLAQLQDMAQREHALALRLRVLKAQLRDLLHSTPQHSAAVTEMQRLLRRKTDEATLQAAIDHLRLQQTGITPFQPTPMTGKDSQNDRHIQSSDKETDEKTAAPGDKIAIDTVHEDVDVETCLTAAPNAAAFSQDRPRSWEDVGRLARTLAPAIGIEDALWHQSRARMGDKGVTLAIIGLVEAYPRIKTPARYLAALLTRPKIDLCRMFRSLTGWARFPAGNLA